MTFGEWLEAAEAHDELTGARAWREVDEDDHYDAASLRKSLVRLRTLRERGAAFELAGTLHEELYRHLGDLGAPELYHGALAGTKRLVEDYFDEAERGLRWLAAVQVPGVSEADKLKRFEGAWAVFGRSALLLSGGATLGFHHFGVVKALFELGLLPHIISGASTGAMIAAGVCARNDAELAEMFADTDSLRLDGLVPASLAQMWRQRSVLDPQGLYDVLRHNIGDRTFAEAFAHSGRVLNISVSPTRRRQKPRLLTHVSAPDVLVASAALASSALPGLFPPVTLEARDHEGRIVPYIPGEKWVDGSIFGDLPMRRLTRLHNVNHFIVSQTNPHVLPFVRHHGRSGAGAAVSGLASATVRGQGAVAADVGRRVLGRGPAAQGAEQLYALFAQDYGGDINLHPQFSWRLYKKIVANPSREDLAAFMLEGQRSVWPRVTQIRAQTRLGRAFRECVELLSAKATGT